ncbi:HhH-GPD-type base excision DNA repair protein [Actinokineospora sp. NBRC 105648]|uniref:HhH-GPD-type base excision DNA repair protein n=1 Tax=Actinokineospora sp. NBRC 105648 TaxID=3032206 RepID=UPI00249FE889|nr:HhH-GPD-type base excision DNA repair protein [Actinokineospora sp. NBRC 105648]GLZ42448.1 (Fe-S)-cluster assembly protein [Actinokineospora sp. NBRC 105648]
MTDKPKLCIAQNPEADALLERSPLALVIGMLLDQQIQMEVAFNGPYKLYTRLGNKLDVHEIANYDPEAFATLATTPPAIHRYGGSMAKRVQTLCQYIAEHYDGNTEAIWTDDKPTGAEVLKRLKALPGYGEQKAKIFLALLGKQLGITPYGWRKAAGDYGLANTRKSVADVISTETLLEVRANKKAAKAAALNSD